MAFDPVSRNSVFGHMSVLFGLSGGSIWPHLTLSGHSGVSDMASRTMAKSRQKWKLRGVYECFSAKMTLFSMFTAKIHCFTAKMASNTGKYGQNMSKYG